MIRRIIFQSLALSLFVALSLFGVYKFFLVDADDLSYNKALNLATEKNWTETLSVLQELLQNADSLSIENKGRVYTLYVDALIATNRFEDAQKFLDDTLSEVGDVLVLKLILTEQKMQLYRMEADFFHLAKCRLELLNIRQEVDKAQNADTTIPKEEIAENFLLSALDYQYAGETKLAQGLYESALKNLEGETDTMHLRPKIYYHFAMLKNQEEDFDEALMFLDKALQEKQLDSELQGQIHYLMGDIYEERREFLKAYELFKQALSVYPNKVLIEKRLDFIEKNYKPELKEARKQ